MFVIVWEWICKTNSPESIYKVISHTFINDIIFLCSQEIFSNDRIFLCFIWNLCLICVGQVFSEHVNSWYDQFFYFFFLVSNCAGKFITPLKECNGVKFLTSLNILLEDCSSNIFWYTNQHSTQFITLFIFQFRCTLLESTKQLIPAIHQDFNFGTYLMSLISDSSLHVSNTGIKSSNFQFKFLILEIFH